MKKHISYICNPKGHICCPKREFCVENGASENGCTHTTIREYSKNYKNAYPTEEQLINRFESYELDKEIYYYEKRKHQNNV